MDTKRLTYEEYTIGWICALPKEQRAAMGMLEEKHEGLENPMGDESIYYLGRIGKHNVAITCLPKNKIGNNNSATTATRMTTTFPNLKYLLMVGIGGGVGLKVRLGDVVVSCAADGFEAVIPWDVGKNEAGVFKRTGFLNNPPTALLNAISTLDTDPSKTRTEMLQYFNKFKNRNRNFIKRHLPEDVLYRADYEHRGGKRDQDDSGSDDSDSNGSDSDGSDSDGSGVESTDAEDSDEDVDDCSRCRRSKIVKREERDVMQIHYGLIASGNQVVKDARFRDELNQRYNNKLLCVEMEAAGIMTDFPCIVIRGICDYADTHKNKAWQEYAAAAAAAYAKTLLKALPASEIRHLSSSERKRELHLRRYIKDLHEAVENGNSQKVQDLLYKGVDAETKNEKGWTPLIAASQAGNINIVRLLLEIGKANVNTKDNNNRTALSWALEGGHYDVVRALFEKGASMDCKWTFGGHDADVKAVTFFQDSGDVVSASQDGLVSVCNEKGKRRQKYTCNRGAVHSIAVSHDANLLAAAAEDRAICILNMELLKCQNRLKGHTKAVCSVAFSSDSLVLASGSRDKTIKLWDLDTDDEPATYKGHTRGVYSVSLSPNGKYMASGSSDTTVRIWSTKNTHCRATLRGHSDAVRSVAFSHDSKMVASGSDDATVMIWEPEARRDRTFQGHTDTVHSVAFSRDSKTLASASADKTIRLWEVSTGRCIQIIRGHTDAVYSVSFSPDSDLVVSASGDKTVKLWDTVMSLTSPELEKPRVNDTPIMQHQLVIHGMWGAQYPFGQGFYY